MPLLLFFKRKQQFWLIFQLLLKMLKRLSCVCTVNTMTLKHTEVLSIHRRALMASNCKKQTTQLDLWATRPEKKSPDQHFRLKLWPAEWGRQHHWTLTSVLINLCPLLSRVCTCATFPGRWSTVRRGYTQVVTEIRRAVTYWSAAYDPTSSEETQRGVNGSDSCTDCSANIWLQMIIFALFVQILSIHRAAWGHAEHFICPCSGAAMI